MSSSGALGANPLPLGHGDPVQLFVATAGQKLNISNGTAASPDVNPNPLVKVERTFNLQQSQVTGDGGEQTPALSALCSADATAQVQPIGVYGGAKSASTNVGSPAENDAVGGYFRGRHSGNGHGIAIFGCGSALSSTAKAGAAELDTENASGTDYNVNSTGYSTMTNIWMNSVGPNRAAVCLAIGNGFGAQFDVGIHVPAQVNGGFTGGVRTATYQDEGTAGTSVNIKGTHATAAIAVATSAGVVQVDNASGIDVSASGQLILGGANTTSVKVNATGTAVIACTSLLSESATNPTVVASVPSLTNQAGLGVATANAFAFSDTLANDVVIYNTGAAGRIRMGTNGTGASTFQVQFGGSTQVNSVRAFGGTTGNAAGLFAVGSDTNVDLQLVCKGSGGLHIPDGAGASTGGRIFAVTGAPGAGIGADGDFAFRKDTPGTANQRLYVHSGGAWVGIL